MADDKKQIAAVLPHYNCVRVKGFGDEDVDRASFKGLVSGPAVILGIYRREHNSVDNSVGTTATIQAKAGDRLLTPEMLWHDECFSPAAAAGPWPFNAKLGTTEQLDVVLNNCGGATYNVSGWVRYAVPEEIPTPEEV